MQFALLMCVNGTVEAVEGLQFTDSFVIIMVGLPRNSHSSDPYSTVSLVIAARTLDGHNNCRMTKVQILLSLLVLVLLCGYQTCPVE